MNYLLFLTFISSLAIANGGYNPIPSGSIIISTVNKVMVMQPTEYGGDNSLRIIFTATSTMTIINSIYNPTTQSFYILFTNDTSGTVFLCQLVSLEQLDSTIYKLPIAFNISDSNSGSFSSDVANQRVFLTNQHGQIIVFAMSGLMQTEILQPDILANQTRSVNYDGAVLNRLFAITDTTVVSCSNLDTNNLQCCEGKKTFGKLHSIAFDQSTGDTIVFVLDQESGIYQIDLYPNGCPKSSRPINQLAGYYSASLVTYRGLYIVSGSLTNNTNNTILLIANGTNPARSVTVGVSIVGLHISYPNIQVSLNTEETCFHGITYNDYRIAVILAAVFGTIMGIFMCFNALFCIDFFMTKSIIRELKKQIPHDLLEDRWNKLVEEKYAKLALEKQRQANDPPPKRAPSIFDRKPAPVSAASGYTTLHPDSAALNSGDMSQGSTSRQKISAFLRRKSDNYFNRRTDEYERQADSWRTELTSTNLRPPRNQLGTAESHIEPVQEEAGQGRRNLRANLSGKDLLKNDEDFL